MHGRLALTLGKREINGLKGQYIHKFLQHKTSHGRVLNKGYIVFMLHVNVYFENNQVTTNFIKVARILWKAITIYAHRYIFKCVYIKYLY